MLAVDSRHFHVADHQVERLAAGALEPFAAIQKNIDVEAFVFQNIGDQAGHGGLVFHDQDTGSAMDGAQRALRQKVSAIPGKRRTAGSLYRMVFGFRGKGSRFDGRVRRDGKFNGEH